MTIKANKITTDIQVNRFLLKQNETCIVPFEELFSVLYVSR